jgi:hypothetical protein
MKIRFLFGFVPYGRKMFSPQIGHGQVWPEIFTGYSIAPLHLGQTIFWQDSGFILTFSFLATFRQVVLRYADSPIHHRISKIGIKSASSK